MATDLCGVIEVRKAPPFPLWESVASLSQTLGGVSYDLFGCLFGVRNFAQFEPLFPDRGLPADLSAGGKQALLGGDDEEGYEDCEPNEFDHHNPSWCTYAELRDVDRSEVALAADRRVHEIELVNGVEVLRSKASWSKKLADAGVYADLEHATEARRGSFIYRKVVLSRGEALRSFEPTLALMASLAEQWGPDNVRVVVWFSS